MAQSDREILTIVHYIEGPKNILADNLSRLNCLITPAQLAEGKILVEPVTDDESDNEEAHFLDLEYSGLFNNEIEECLECYLNLPDSQNPEQNPLSFAYICEQQQADQICWLFNKNIQTTILRCVWMMMWKTSYAMLKIYMIQ